MGFPRQEYWSRLPFPSPGDLTKPGIEPRSPTLQVDSLPTEPQGKPSTQNNGRFLKCPWYSNSWLFRIIPFFFYLPFQPPEDPKFLGSSLCSCCCETLQRRALGVNFISFSCWVSNVPCRHGHLDLSMMGKELIYKTFACVLSHSVMFHSLKPQRP